MALPLPTNITAGTAGAIADHNLAWGVLNQIGMSGTGSPEGVVTAPVGSVYRDTAATNGAVLWLKATGSGNTGWKVIYGDTGSRNVAALVTATGATAESTVTRLQRIGGWVWFGLEVATTGSYSTGSTLLAIPAGFRPPADMYLNPGYDGGSFLIAANALKGYWTPPTTRRWFGCWPTSDAWPSGALPGTAG